MGVKKCDIFYENSSDTFYSGQTINGRVDFTFDSPKKVRGIHIQFKGEANVFWTESETRKNAEGRDETYQVQYNAHEEYFKIKYYLTDSSSGSEITFPAGTHSFPFTCALPPSLPTSFEGEHGYVRYTIKVTLDRPWKFDQEYKFAFTVISVLDLNLKPELKNPVHREKSETFCCCCCESGPFTMTVTIPCSGFVPGQKIPIHIDCDNASDVKIKHVKVRLQKIVSYHSHNPQRKTKHSEVDLVTNYLKSIQPGENVAFDKTIIVPPLPSSNLENCGIIDIKYGIWIKAKVGGCHESPTECIPIMIGTIPLHDFVNELRTENGQSEGNDKQPLISPPTCSPTQDQYRQNQPPPPGASGWNPNFTQSSYNPHATPNSGQQPPYPTATSYPPPVNQSATPYPIPTPYPTNSQTTPYPPPYPSNLPYPPANPPYPTAQNPPRTAVPSLIDFNSPPPIPPPAFEESQFKSSIFHDKDDNEHTNTQNFAPKYPVYNFPPSAPPPPS